jgi:2-polyprenyl-6-methoxyphenol hydroxylase-like FAD-dependent oxidoreductase
MDTEVLIVGGGPTGLTLAIDLGRRGIRCILIEQKEAPAFLPKMERINARSMEIFRRMGLAEKIRAAGLRPDVPMDVFVVLSLNEPPLLRSSYPSVNEAQADNRATNDGSAPRESYQLISQYTLEPLLKREAEGMESVTVQFGCEFLSLDQDADGVTAKVQTAKGSVETIRASYVVGCDGGGSPVRKEIGIKLRGEGSMQQFRQALYKCDELFDRLPNGNGPGKGRHYHFADKEQSFLIMQDSTQHWTLHATVDSDEGMKTQFEKIVGFQVKYEMLSCNPWRQNLLLADRYQSGRVFIAGDAAHLVIPTGGLGMNSGVCDATDLSWKLAATLRGWGGPALLATYEFERRQVGDRNVGASRYASSGRRKWRSMWRPNIREESAEGRHTRDVLIRVASVEQRKSNEMIGAELGYRYINSAAICDIPGGPDLDFREYIPTIWPGARLPNVWLADGSAVQDHVSDGFTILRLGNTKADANPLADALKAAGAPVTILDIPDRVAREIYDFDLLLLRPDLHIVWRGHQPPEDPQWVARVATGHQV